MTKIYARFERRLDSRLVTKPRPRPRLGTSCLANFLMSEKNVFRQIGNMWLEFVSPRLFIG